jgi:hypothetical protein
LGLGIEEGRGMALSPVRALVCGALLAALVLAVSCGQTVTPASSPSPTPTGGPSGVAVSGGAAAEASGVTVAGVVPQAGSTVWNGDIAIVDYRRENVDEQSPAQGDVDAARCRLTIDGRPCAAAARRIPVSPAAFSIVFSWGEAYPAGPHAFRAVMPLIGGGRVICSWTATKG